MKAYKVNIGGLSVSSYYKLNINDILFFQNDMLIKIIRESGVIVEPKDIGTSLHDHIMKYDKTGVYMSVTNCVSLNRLNDITKMFDREEKLNKILN